MKIKNLTSIPFPVLQISIKVKSNKSGVEIKLPALIGSTDFKFMLVLNLKRDKFAETIDLKEEFIIKMVTEKALDLARKLWNYHHVNHTLEKADCILVLGSHDTRVADRAAELYLDGWAPIIIFSGGLGRLTEGMWTESEADLFAKIAIEKGVPKDAILIENKSTNTGENILLTQKLLKENSLDPESFIVVQKPYMERRSFATFKKHWPEKKLIVTSPQIAFEDYATGEIPMEQVVNIMVGDFQRIKLYAEMGFQVYQEIPEDAWAAYEELIQSGYTEHLVK